MDTTPLEPALLQRLLDHVHQTTGLRLLPTLPVDTVKGYVFLSHGDLKDFVLRGFLSKPPESRRPLLRPVQTQSKALPKAPAKSKTAKPKAPKTPKVEKAPGPRAIKPEPPAEFTKVCELLLQAARKASDLGLRVGRLAEICGYDIEGTGKLVKKLVEDKKLAVREGTKGPGTHYIVVKAAVSEETPTSQTAALLKSIPKVLVGARVGLDRSELQAALGRTQQRGGVVMNAVRELIQRKIVKVIKDNRRFLYALDT